MSCQNYKFHLYLCIYPSFLKNGLIIISLLAKTIESKHLKKSRLKLLKVYQLQSSGCHHRSHGDPLPILTHECNYEHLITSLWQSERLNILTAFPLSIIQMATQREKNIISK